MKLCLANNMPAPFVVRVNTLKTTKERLIEYLNHEGIVTEETKYAPEGIVLTGLKGLRGFKPFEEGLFQVQDESSMLVSHALKPSPGSLVIDAAAAPGGKSTHMAQLMGNMGTIKAFDIHPHKIKLIENNFERLGITCIQAELRDARKVLVDMDRKADFVLLDAPCTGTGVIRRKPDSRWRKEPEQLPEILELQKEMLQSLAQSLKPGGVLLYSTCSVLPEENQEQVKTFLKNNPSFETEDLEGFLPESLTQGKAYKGYIQLYPHIHNTDGFFICRMRRRE